MLRCHTVSSQREWEQPYIPGDYLKNDSGYLHRSWFPIPKSLYKQNRKLSLYDIEYINQIWFPMKETFRKLYVVSGDVKSKVGNTCVEQGIAVLYDAETPAIACC